MTCKYLACLRPIHASACITGALALIVCLVGGCSKEEPREEVPESVTQSVPPEEYMKDEAFRTALKEERHHRAQLAAQRARILKKMQEMSLATVAKMPNATEAEIVAELEKNPEWNSLKARVEDLVRAHEESHATSLETVRKRLVTEQPVSK